MTTTREALAADLAARHDLDETAAREAVTIYAGQLGAPDGDLTDEAAADADRAWRAAIRAALIDGQRAVDVALAAGISRERVYQIRDGRR